MSENDLSHWNLNLSEENSVEVEESINLKELFDSKGEWKSDVKKLRTLNNYYWNSIHRTLKNKITVNCNFSSIEKTFCDFGIFTGKQLASDPEVIDAVKSNEGFTEDEVYEIIYETLYEEAKEFKINDSRVYTLTSWIESRYVLYRTLANSMKIKMTPKLLKQLPVEFQQFNHLRNQRIVAIQSIKRLLEKTPGVNSSLSKNILSGSVHDELDYLKTINPMTREIGTKINNISNTWKQICKNLLSIFRNNSLENIVSRINEYSTEIHELCVSKKLNLELLKDAQKDLLNNEEVTLKTLKRDVYVIKNNLNLASMKSKRKQYMPCRQKFDHTLDTTIIGKFLSKTLFYDRHSPVNSKLLLAPGDFEGFYEMDYETLVIPIYGDHMTEWMNAAVEYRFIIETLKDKSSFLESLHLLGDNPRKDFKQLYFKWFNTPFLSDTDVFEAFSDEECKFLYEHVAINEESFLLNKNDYYLSSEELKEAIEKTEHDGWSANYKKRVIAAQYYRANQFEKSLTVLNSLPEVDMFPINYICKNLVRIKLGEQISMLDGLDRFKYDEMSIPIKLFVRMNS